MKNFGCILEFTRLRNLDLMRCYRYQISTMPFVRLSLLGERIVNMPAQRFYVSEDRAAVVVSQILRGRRVLDTMRQPKREMFEEILRRYIILHDKMPDVRPFEIVSEIVNAPAPKFYMAPRTAIEIIYKIKSGFYGQFYN